MVNVAADMTRDKIAFMTRKQKPPGRKPGRPRKPDGTKKGPAYSVRFPELLAVQLEELLRRTRRQKSTEIFIAIEDHLARHGLWPPGAKPSEEVETK